MARKPVHLEMIGGKSPRQRVWEFIRKHRKEFDHGGVVQHAKVTESIARDYLRALLKAEFIAVVSEERINPLCVKRTYTLARDNGLEAPRLTKDGTEVVQGTVNDSMWGTLRRMFKAESVDYRQLAAFASTTRTPVPEATAKAYVLALADAGYLECVQAAVVGSRPARYRLLPGMDSGRRAPMIQRTKVIFDPNWNKVVWTEDKGMVDEQ